MLKKKYGLFRHYSARKSNYGVIQRNNISGHGTQCMSIGLQQYTYFQWFRVKCVNDI